MRILIFFCFVYLSGCSAISKNDFPVHELDYPEHLKIIKRSEWGWMPLPGIIEQHKIKYITIHHGGVEFTEEKNPEEHVKNLQSWSREEKSWIDIPYHFMIDLEGNIFEARPINYPGDTNTEYDPTNHAQIEVMGNYEIQELNESQIKSLVELIAFLSLEFEVDTTKIKTHKDYSNMTVCPGKNIYKYFEDGKIISEVKKLLD